MCLIGLKLNKETAINFLIMQIKNDRYLLMKNKLYNKERCKENISEIPNQFQEIILSMESISLLSSEPLLGKNIFNIPKFN